jgi:hypothetical protein
MLTSSSILLLLTLLLTTSQIYSQTDVSEIEEFPESVGPFASLLGQELYALEMISDTQAQLLSLPTDMVLNDAKVVGLYFSADWCGKFVI